MPRKKKEEKQLDGTVDIKQAVDALCDIEKDYGILPEESLSVATTSFNSNIAKVPSSISTDVSILISSNFRGFFCTCL